jgi:hypothetical protein
MLSELWCERKGEIHWFIMSEAMDGGEGVFHAVLRFAAHLNAPDRILVVK